MLLVNTINYSGVNMDIIPCITHTRRNNMKAFKRFLALILVLCLAAGNLAVTASAATTAKPANGTTTAAPFPKGTAGSNSFRIPALVTLSDGTLVAAADARWNTTYDGGCLDTIVSRSVNNGSTWSYSFANYLGDNGNTYNGSGSTAFIDPALAVTADDTIYMLCDLYPYGIALNGSGNTAPTTSKGFDSQGRLLLKSGNQSSYSYYLENGKIYKSTGSVVSGYTVDAYFNITGNGVNTNLFFSDSPYKVVRTGFLYLTKSTDGGVTWSAPQLLDLKTTSEQVCLVGPGRGLVTASGMIVFPVYSYNGSQNTQKLGFLYSTNNGATWSRSSNFTGATWSSESAVVELADGTLRFFYRNGTTNLCYVDYNVSRNSWGSAVNTGLDTNSNCQISAITYSRTSDGKQVILVSCPTGPSEAGSDQSGASYRLNGKIFVGTVGSNNTMSWVNSIRVTSNNSPFMYSCLTELADGSVAILYENKENSWGAGSNCYYTMDFKTYGASSLGLTFDDDHTHAYEAVVTAPTCSDQGYTTYTCAACGDSYTDNVVAPLGHSYQAVTKEATCQTPGSVTYTCSGCGDSYSETVPALAHTYKAVTKEATCQTPGSVTYTCTGCGDSYSEAIPALAHSYKAVTKEATCQTPGSVTYTCTGCGDSYSETIPTLAHTYETTGTAATCVSDGSVTHTCIGCGHSYSEAVSALGHNYETVTVNATCDKDGSVTTACSRCGDSSTEVIPATGHSYETVTVEATCDKNGSVTTRCRNCGEATTEVIEAYGHSYTASTVAATCVSDGYTVYTCSRCADAYTTGYTSATGHDYAVTETADALVYTCRSCGHSYSESLAVEYSYSKATSFRAGENYVITFYSSRSYYALTHTGNKVSAVKVTVSNNKVTSEVTEDMLWSYDSNKLFYESGDATYYLYAASSGNRFNSTTTLSLSTSKSSSVSFSSSRVKVGSSYLRYSGGKVSLNRSATTAYLFQQVED